jgi:SSS family solute:Na+ symporter
MTGLRWLDLAVIVIYMAAMLLVGLRFARRQTTTESYFVAKRSIPSWALGISIYAALITSITFIAYPGSAYAGNWNELVPGFMAFLVLLVVGAVVIPFYRHAVGMSAYEYFERRFGYKVRAYSAFAFAMGHFSKMGFVFFTTSLTVSGITGWNIYVVMIGTGLVTVTYTVMGGLEAVIWTDVIQGFVKVIGVVVTLGVLCWIMPGGISAGFDAAWQQHKFSLGSTAFDFSQKGAIWPMLLYGLFFYLQKYGADQTFVQRYLVAKTDRQAWKGVLLGATLCVPAWAVFMLIGTLIWAYYHLSHEVLPLTVDKADKVFPHFLATKVPAGLAGLFMASLFSAAMAMLSSDLNCLSVVFVEDFYRRLKPQATDRQRLWMGKMTVGVCGTLAILIAVVIAWKSERVLSLYLTASSIVAGGLAGLFMLAFLCPRANARGAGIGIVACLAFTAWGTLTAGKAPTLDLGAWNCRMLPIMVGVWAHVVLFVVGYLASWLSAAPVAENRSMTLWGWLDRKRTAGDDE